MKAYLDLMQHILDQGIEREDRTGTGTKSIFGYQMRFDLLSGFPLVTTKRCHFKSIVHELLWFLRGETNLSYLKKNGVGIWDQWADDQGDLGPIYGYQWRSWPTPSGESVDQIARLLQQIKTTPYSRRLIVSSWNVASLPDETLSPGDNAKNQKMALSPCHALFQFYVANGKLSCQLYQRSADIFLGVPFNIASYALLTLMLAQVSHLQPGDFVHTFGDVHLYANHIQQAKQQLSRKPYPLPEIRLNPAIQSIDDFTYEDIKLINYQCHEPIAAPIAV